MVKSQEILSGYGVSLSELGAIFPDLRELVELAQQPSTLATSGTLQSIDLQLAAFLTSPSAIKKLKTLQKKQPKAEDQVEAVVEQLEKLGGLGDSLISFDEFKKYTSEGVQEVETPTQKLLHTKTYAGIDISAFLTDLSGEAIPMVSEDLNLILRRDGLVIQAKWSDDFKAQIQVSTSTILPLSGLKVEVVVSSYKKMDVESFNYAGIDAATFSEESELPQKDLESELTSLFSSEGIGEDSYSFDEVAMDIESLNSEGLMKWDFPNGITLHPHYTQLSNFFYTPSYLYSLEDCDRFEQVGLDSGSYTTNTCDSAKTHRLLIYERGGNHLNAKVAGMDESISNSADVDEQFVEFVAPTLNLAFRKASTAYLVGFQPNVKGQESVKDGGYFVVGTNGQPNYMFIPAVIYNYFAKYYEFDTIRTYFGKKSNRIVIFEKSDVVMGYYELPNELIISLNDATRVFPNSPSATAKEIYGKNASSFTQKVDLSPQEVEEKVADVVIEDLTDDDPTELIDDTEFMIEIYSDSPDEELTEDIDFNLEILADIGAEDKAKDLRKKFDSLNKVKKEDTKDTEEIEEEVVTEEIEPKTEEVTEEVVEEMTEEVSEEDKEKFDYSAFD